MAVVARILDANSNRAREALRVMEEYARFVLDDALLTTAIKEVRHEVGEAARAVERIIAIDRPKDGAAERTDLRPLRQGSLAIARDIVGDVGRDISTPRESIREDDTNVALTAAKRLGEALRVLEEYGKTIDRPFAAAMEKLRYRGYELERRLQMTADARRRFTSVRLYVIVTESRCRGDWFETAEAALRGGANCVQLREKDLPDRELLHRARRLVRLCHDHSALLILNDRPDIAEAAGADGVHLGQDDLPIAAARRVLPARCIVGISTHTIEQVRRAAEQAPDYIAVGPMFASSTKPQGHIAGPQTLNEARTLTGLPLVAIGGIDDRNAGSVLAAAPCCLCVCSTVTNVADSEAAARSLIQVAQNAFRR